MPRKRKHWTYRQINVYPADTNSSGIRWYAFCGIGICLKADSKASMRQLITRALNTGNSPSKRHAYI